MTELNPDDRKEGRSMRGRIIHYDPTTGTGRISAREDQFAFGIQEWASDTAPMVNQVVELSVSNGVATSVRRVSDEVLFRERTADLAGRLGSAGHTALGHLREIGFSGHADGSPSGGNAAPSVLSGLKHTLGVPVLALWALFGISAFALPFVRIPWGFGVRSFTLSDVGSIGTELREIGVNVIGPSMLWVALASIVAPVLVRSRWAWLALALPLVAVLKPTVEAISVMRQLSEAMAGLAGLIGAGGETEGVRASFRTGFWLSLFSASGLAWFGVRRTMHPRSHPRI